MCDPVTALLATSTAVGVYGQVQGAKQQRNALQGQAAAMEEQAQQVEGAAYLQAAQTRDEAMQQARLFRRAGQRLRASTTVAQAASGVRVGEGSAAIVDDALLRDSETDAAMAILTGERRAAAVETGGRQDAASLRSGAGNARTAASQATRAGYLSAATTVLGSAASYTRWNTAMAPKAAQPASRAYTPYGDPFAGY